MKESKFIIWLEDLDASHFELAGGKGANLGELVAMNQPVPDGFVVTTDAYRYFLNECGLQYHLDELSKWAIDQEEISIVKAGSKLYDMFVHTPLPQELRESILDAYSEIDYAPVAIRSSATNEDLTDASFAGQQESFLNEIGSDALMNGIRKCWGSLWKKPAISYRIRNNFPVFSNEMAVIVQRMAQADISGVVFTANPINGLDQILINSSWGLGESIVQGIVTPDNIIIDKINRCVLSYDLGLKETMTVAAQTSTQEIPVSKELRNVRTLNDQHIQKLIDHALLIEKHYGMPMDIEWAIDGKSVNILQARPITTLSEPTPSTWPIENPHAVYVRTSLVELLPDPLSPLFEDIAVTGVNRAIQKVAYELFNEPCMQFYHFTTVNGYAYYANHFPPRAIWLLVRALPRLFLFFKNGEERWRNNNRPQYLHCINKWSTTDTTTLDTHELIRALEEIITSACIYYTSVQALLWKVVPSEIIFSWYYDKFVRKNDDPPSSTLLLGTDSLPIRADKSLYELAQWCQSQPMLVESLTKISSTDVKSILSGNKALVGVPQKTSKMWIKHFNDYLDEYGHMVYSLDFFQSLPADEPNSVFQLFQYYLKGLGQNPAKRQQKAQQRSKETIELISFRLSWFRRIIFRRLVVWARYCTPLREDALSDISLGWPLARDLAQECGERLVSIGSLKDVKDVFWLRSKEIKDVLDENPKRCNLDGLFYEIVDQRKSLWQARKRALPPQILPVDSKILGIDVSRWLPAQNQENSDDTLLGIGASPGVVIAPARIISGPDDFSNFRRGEVLVANITTPAWTPLFTIAAAVVTDIGGPLSHSSIVAREYGIPAVLGTGIATRRIRTGTSIQVDGDIGKVTLDMFLSSVEGKFDANNDDAMKR